MKRNRKMKWWVCGSEDIGGEFTNLKDAKACAKEASEYCGEAQIYLIEDGCHYIDYENGKCIRDGWTIRK